MPRLIPRQPHPYQAPLTAPEQLAPPRARSVAIPLAMGLLCSLLAALLPTLVVPSFWPIFEAFGEHLPLITALALNYYLLLWLWPLGFVVVFLCWPAARHRGWVPCLTGVLGLLASLVLLAVSMYGPIFSLG